MTPFVDDPDFQLYLGDALEVLRELPAESVHCCVTSPPYWGLRDYGTGTWAGGDPDCEHPHPKAGDIERNLATSTLAGTGQSHAANGPRVTCSKCGARRVDQQLGLEPTPDQYVANIVNVFREVRRVLRKDGTLWLNIGDSYNAARNGGWAGGKGALNEGRDIDAIYQGRSGANVDGLKQKDLVGIPWRLGFALQADGWYLRSDIIWSKPNPMPESVTDRPTKAHEYLFLLTKSPRYFYDADAIREPYEPSSIERSKYGINDMRSSVVPHAGGVKMPTGADTVLRHDLRKPQPAPQAETLGDLPPESPRGADGRRQTHIEGRDGSEQHRDGERWPGFGRNKRSVWEIATEPYPDAHFATFPQALVEPCVKAGCPECVCGTCGKARERIVERQPLVLKEPAVPIRERRGDDVNDKRTALSGTQLIPASSQTIGWSDCGHNNYQPGTVLDPFLGSGTTALVARRLGRKCVGIELNPDYAQLCAKRLQQLSLFASEHAEA